MRRGANACCGQRLGGRGRAEARPRTSEATARILNNDPKCNEKPLETWHDLICIFKNHLQATVWRIGWWSTEMRAKGEEVEGVSVRSGVDLNKGGDCGDRKREPGHGVG